MRLFEDISTNGEATSPYARVRGRLAAARLPRERVAQVEQALLHRSDAKWSSIDRFLDKAKRDGVASLEDPADPDVRAIHLLARAVARDLHKMHAFVRFRPLRRASGRELLFAHFEPAHLILKAAAPFFSERFGAFEWWIHTPSGSAHWNGTQLELRPDPLWAPDDEARDLVAQAAASVDPGVEDWKTYYANIFNPARVKVAAMKKEMPKKYWKHLPEAELIPQLLRDAPTRVAAMLETKSETSAYDFLPEGGGLAALATAARDCRGCDLCEKATHTVFGTGSISGRLVIVGEQPGNEEDLQGRPFIGPAGRLLREELALAGIDIEAAYVTNAVKHFHWTPWGKMRLHQTPKLRHIRACRPWLDAELKLVKPRVVLCLGATAAQAVFGFPLAVQKNRGVFRETTHCEKTFLTVHPSYLLRLNDLKERTTETERFRAELALVKSALIADLERRPGD